MGAARLAALGRPYRAVPNRVGGESSTGAAGSRNGALKFQGTRQGLAAIFTKYSAL